MSGSLVGSWAAGTIAKNSTPEGITIHGTDVWIVDSKSDKVFRYAGAASRLSGSQNAASSFNLNSGNGNPKDIVTDGQSLWVVNDATPDKVFKYSSSGSLLGSWTIDAANRTPTGITIDPANVSDIWIVDSGTDRVYQYNAAATRTSGSQSAALTFALAAGNTNPQGIADPPAPSMEVSSSVIDTRLETRDAEDRQLTHKRGQATIANRRALVVDLLNLSSQQELYSARAESLSVASSLRDTETVDAVFATVGDSHWPTIAPEIGFELC